MEIEHEQAGHRFVAHVEGGEAEVTYIEREGGVMDLVHTFVPEAAREQGVAQALAETAFRYAREKGLKVRPTCPYVRKWLENHPDQRDFVG